MTAMFTMTADGSFMFETVVVCWSKVPKCFKSFWKSSKTDVCPLLFK